MKGSRVWVSLLTETHLCGKGRIWPSNDHRVWLQMKVLRKYEELKNGLIGSDGLGKLRQSLVIEWSSMINMATIIVIRKLNDKERMLRSRKCWKNDHSDVETRMKLCALLWAYLKEYQWVSTGLWPTHFVFVNPEIKVCTYVFCVCGNRANKCCKRLMRGPVT